MYQKYRYIVCIPNLFCGICTNRARSVFSFSSTVSNKMYKPSVYITREINKEALDILNEHCEVTSWTGLDPVPRDELLEKIENKNALFCMLTDVIDSKVLDKAGQNLQIIATMSVGYDHLEIQEIKKRNIKISYTPDILTDATAELAVALLLTTSRRLLEANEAAKKESGKPGHRFGCVDQDYKTLLWVLLDSVVLVKKSPRDLKHLTQRILFIIIDLKKSKKPNKWMQKVSFDQLLTESDFISVSCSLTSETMNLFNAAAFKKMKSTAVFVNTSRGGVVDQDALINALENKTIWGAGLDVMTPEPLPLDNPLLKLKNCVVLPHIGSACIETRQNMAILCAKNIIAALKGEQMPSELII